MKNILSILLIAISTIMHGQSNDRLLQDSIVYLTDSQEAFMVDKETKYLFKLGPLGYERKLSPSFSINTVIQPSYTGSGGLRMKAGLDLRYYYKMSKLISEGKQADNLSSEYFSAGIRYNGTLFSSFDVGTTNYNISWGSQKRFLNYGYFDFGLTLGYNYTDIDLTIFGQDRYTSNSFVLSTRTAVGFAFGQNYSIDEVVKCPIFKCNLDRKKLLKVNFNKLFSIGVGTNTLINDEYRLIATLNPNIAFEHKIGSSSFSVDHDFDFLLGLSSKISNIKPEAGISRYRLGYTGSLKYYFQMSSKIKKGKSGNNLSGYYAFAAASFQYGDSKLPLFGENIAGEIGKHSYTEFPFGVGYQKTVLNDYYFDFRLGLNLRINETSPPLDPDLANSGVILDFKVGKSF